MRSVVGISEVPKKRRHGPLGSSCLECKRRKIRCDKSDPCGSCVPNANTTIGRKCPHLCVWEAPPYQSSQANHYATIRQVQVLMNRVEHLEHLLRMEGKFPMKKEHRDPDLDGFSDGEGQSRNSDDAVMELESRFEAIGSGDNKDNIQSRPLGSECLFKHKPFVLSEITEWGTSVLATEEMTHKDEYELREIVKSVVPHPFEKDSLLTSFFRNPDWMSKCVDYQIFTAEVNFFYSRILPCYLHDNQSAYNPKVDPLWLALFFQVLASGAEAVLVKWTTTFTQGLVHSSYGTGTSFYTSSRETVQRRASECLSASQRCLVLGSHTTIPRIRTIQTAILFGQYLQITAVRQTPDFLFWSSLAIAVRLCFVLGLHQLGREEHVMPPDDPALPVGKNSLKRQMALRIFGMICFHDWMSANSVDRPYLIHPSVITSELPMNVPTLSLSKTEYRVRRMPNNNWTDVSFERIKLQVARMMQVTHEKILCGKCGYGEIVQIDTEYQEILKHLPEPFKRADLPIGSRPEDETIQWQKYASLDAIHYRLMRLHRPWLISRKAESEYKYSKEACLRSAGIVITSVYELRESLSHFWHIYSHAFVAATVLFADLFWSISMKISPKEIHQKRQTLLMTRDIFVPARIPLGPLHNVVTQAGAAIETLLDFGQTKAANVEADQQAHNSFVQVLHQITSQLKTLFKLDISGPMTGDIEPMISGSVHDASMSTAITHHLDPSTFTSANAPVVLDPYTNEGILQLMIEDLEKAAMAASVIDQPTVQHQNTQLSIPLSDYMPGSPEFQRTPSTFFSTSPPPLMTNVLSSQLSSQSFQRIQHCHAMDYHQSIIQGLKTYPASYHPT